MRFDTPLIAGGVEIPGRLMFAPLAGYSDYPLRRRVRACGAALVFTEMVSAAALARSNHVKRSWFLTRHTPEEKPLAVQLFGGNPDDFAGAVSRNDFSPFAFIDINMGCPVRKVIRSGGGSALLTDTDKMMRIIRAARENTPVPVSVKLRLGMKSDGAEVARVQAVEAAGAAFITVHARYTPEMFSGEPHWDTAARMREAVRHVPFVANGNVNSRADAERIRDLTNADALMIGRGGIGNPWLFSEILSDPEHYTPPTVEQMRADIHQHLKDMIDLYGEKSGVKNIRKHLVRYCRHFSVTKAEKIAMVVMTERGDIERFIDNLHR
ncbi:MAG: tRNA-dihydrouridine synthase family protein [Spirochaetes bacterium]|nr:tRNA-dihydrouridine synthase family protein [Spirochaetota bacterium]